jgi:hypothetical protein
MDDKQPGTRFDRVIAVIVALEHYRTPSSGEALPSVDYARADAEAFAAVARAEAGRLRQLTPGASSLTFHADRAETPRVEH